MNNFELPKTIDVSGEEWTLYMIDYQTGDTYPAEPEHLDNRWLEPIYKP